MNLVLLFKKDFIAGASRVCLKGRRYSHVCDIHKAKVGDELCVGLEGGLIGRGKIVRMSDKVLEMDVTLNRKPPLPLDMTLLLALPRPIVLKRVILAVTSMGVKRIILFHSRRVEKSYWRSHALEKKALDEQIILGLEQAKDTIMPEISIYKRFKPFVEDKLPDIIKGTLALLAHPESSQICPRDVKQSVTLAIGPEGGFIPYEIEKLEEIGFSPVCFGDRILRVDTAVSVLISRLF